MAQLQTVYGISPSLVTVDNNLRLVSVEGNRRKFVMPSGEPNSSDKFFALTGTAGTPTNLSVPEGSLAFNAATKKPFFFDGTSWVQWVTSGTVSSVGLSAPAEFTVSGSPVTGSGTLTLTKANQSANLVWAGPSAGGPLAPTFRNLVLADLPAIPAESWAETLLAGSVSDGVNPIISSGDQVVFVDGIKINGGNNTAGTANHFGSLAVGYGANAASDLSTALGYLASVAATAVNASALGTNSDVGAGHSSSIAIGGSTTAANQIRMGAGQTVSIPGQLDVESDAFFHQALTMDPMDAANDAFHVLTVPTYTADPTSTPLDGSLMVETTENKLFYRSSGTWFGVALHKAAGASATNQVIAAATLNVKLNLATSDFDTGGIVDLVNDWLSFGLNETWLVEAFVKGDDNGSNHSGNVALLARIRWTNNVTTTTESEVEFPWSAGTNTTFAGPLSAIIRTGATGVQRVFLEFDNTTGPGANNDCRVLTLQFRAARFS